MSNRFRRLTRQKQDYLEEILIEVKRNKVARVSNIAREIGVAPASVSESIKGLVKNGFVEHDAYGYISLTPKGEATASEVWEKHTKLKEFYSKVLLLSENESERNACRVEHVISDVFFERLKQLLNFIDSSKNGRLRWVENFKYFLDTGKSMFDNSESIKSLNELTPDDSGRILKIRGRGKTQQRILDLGLRPGVVVSMKSSTPLGDQLKIRVGNTDIAIRKSEAAHILVDIEK